MKVFELTFIADIKGDGNKQEIKTLANDLDSAALFMQHIAADPRTEFISCIAKEI